MALVLTVASAGLILGGCGSDDSGGTPADRKAAAGAPTTCSGRANVSFTMRLANRLDTDLRVEFSQIDCSDWRGRTPAFYSPVNLGAETKIGAPARAELVVGINAAFSGTCKSPWNTRLVTPEGKTMASFRTGIKCGVGSSNVYLGIWNGAFFETGTFVPIPAELAGGKAAKVGSNGRQLTIEYMK